MVTVTAGRLEPPSAVMTSGGTTMPVASSVSSLSSVVGNVRPMPPAYATPAPRSGDRARPRVYGEHRATHRGDLVVAGEQLVLGEEREHEACRARIGMPHQPAAAGMLDEGHVVEAALVDGPPDH